MRRFLIITGQEFRETLRSKPFIIISVFLAVILVAAAVLSFVMMSDSDESKSPEPVQTEPVQTEPVDVGEAEGEQGAVSYQQVVGLEDNSENGVGQRLREELPYIRFDDVKLDEAGIEDAIKQENCDAYIRITSGEFFDIYESTSLYGGGLSGTIQEALVKIGKTDALTALGVEKDAAEAILDANGVYYVQHPVGGYNVGKYIYNYSMIILMFLVIGLYGQMVATRVATEKSSRTMEVLATTVKPSELLCGKVIGVGAAGFLQLLLFILCAGGIVSGVMARSPELSYIASQVLDISALDIICLCGYFLLGFLLMAFIFGGLGSMVSQVEDLSGVASLPLYVFMLGYFVAIFTSSSGYVSGVMRIASYVPFWSPITMFSRMSMEEVPPVEIAISLGLLAVTCALMAWLSAKLYRSGMLRYGNPPKLRDIVKLLKKD